MGIAGRRGSAPIPQLAQGVFPLCPFNPAEISENEIVFPFIEDEGRTKL
jgi:hypothetical protein